MLGQQWQAGEAEQQADGKAGVAAGQRVFHGSIAGRMTGHRIGKGGEGKTWVIGKRLLPDCGCVACAGLIAGKPAPTSTAPIASHAQFRWEQLSLEIYFQACHSGRASLDTA